MKVCLLFVPLLAGCPGVVPCPDVLPPPVAACVAPVGGWTESPASVEEVSAAFAGDVVDAGVGSPPEAHCFQEMHPGDQRPPSELDVVWARVNVGGPEWFVALSTPGIGEGVLPEIGQELSVDYRYRFGGFGPDVGHATLWDGAGDLLAWVGEAGNVDGLTTPLEVSVAQGAEVCSDADDCGAWSRYDLSLAVGDQSSAALAYGEDVDIAGFQVVHGGYELSTSSNTDCMDWFVGSVQVAVVRR